jgi:hypothetical protein
MSTTISGIHDDLYSMMASLFPSKKVLADSLNLYNNDEIFLADGFAIYIGPANNTKREVACRLSVSRQIVISLTKAPFAGHKDIDKLKATEKALLEELHIVINDFSKNDSYATLRGVKRDYLSDGGIIRAFGESRSILSIQASFNVEYFENLT